jgi:hypothetical protein
MKGGLAGRAACLLFVKNLEPSRALIGMKFLPKGA